MKARVKRIIAREGLTLLGILLVGFCLLYASQAPIFSAPTKAEREETAFKIQNLMARPGYASLDVEQKRLLASYKRSLEKGLRPDKAGFKWLNQWLDGEGLVFPLKMYDLRSAGKDPVRSFSLNILFFGYPLYLLISFALWAVRTLRKNDPLMGESCKNEF